MPPNGPSANELKLSSLHHTCSRAPSAFQPTWMKCSNGVAGFVYGRDECACRYNRGRVSARKPHPSLRCKPRSRPLTFFRMLETPTSPMNPSAKHKTFHFWPTVTVKGGVGKKPRQCEHRPKTLRLPGVCVSGLFWMWMPVWPMWRPMFMYIRPTRLTRLENGRQCRLTD